MTPLPERERLAEQLAAEFVHHLFPSFRMPGFLACPDDLSAQSVLAAIMRAAGSRGVAMEVVDLRPAPAELLNGVTQRLREFHNVRKPKPASPIRILALDGFDLLEGPDNEGPTYPFRSKFQFDEDYRWLFLGRDWHRLQRMFGSYRLPLYHAATDLTPALWQTPKRG